MPGLTELAAEAGRQLTICNSCRYCEGYCAVFPALERRSTLEVGDVAYLANLCHDCRACLQACMYAPPHEFGVEIPRILTEVRAKTYEEYARPRPLAGLFRHGSSAVAAMTVVGLVLAMAAVALAGNLPGLWATHSGPGSFYEVIPYYLMLVPALAATVYVLAALAGASVLFTRAARGSRAGPPSATALLKAAADAIGLRYLSGGGEGCYYANPDRPSALRRVLHSLLVYGFGAAFLSTLLAALYQNVLGQPPPYPLLSAPVLTGAAGGLAMIAGSSGLILLKLRSPRVAGRVMLDLDLAFLANLDLASITGMLLLALRGTSLMGSLLVAHLAVLVALFATAPYGKFVHAVHRFGALVLNRLEVATGSPR